MIETQHFRNTIAEAVSQSRKLKITFRREAVRDVNYLLGMTKAGIIQLNMSDEAVLLAVVQFNDWDGDRNRTVVVSPTDKFDEEWFIGRMQTALERIGVQ